MPAAIDRIEFVPPPAPGRAASLTLALIAHLLLMLALTWGINWNREPQDLAVEAELWSKVPEQAAPAPVPVPQQPVVQAPPITAPPPPPAKVEAPAAPEPAKQPDIQVQQEKRRQEEARRREELERQKQLEAKREQQELERKKELEARRKRDEAVERQKELEARRKEEQDKRVAERKAAEKKRADEQAKAKAKEEQQAKVRESIREQQINRMRGLASGTGAPTSTGVAERSSGPSASYAGKIAARVRPNIVFTDVMSGNPAAVVHLRVAPDGTIVGSRLVKSSGVKSWDDAVLRAIEKTETIPRDVDGRVVPEFDIVFHPKD